MRPQRRLLSTLGAALVAVIAIGGCSANQGASSPDSGAAGTRAEAGPRDGSAPDQAATADQAPASAAGAGDALPQSSLLAQVGDQLMIVTGSISLVTADPLAAADQIATAAFAAGGRVDARSESGSGSNARASLTIRLPGDKTNPTIEKIKKMGTANVEVGQQDVTNEAIDLDQRISGLEASVARMEELIKKASSTSDILSIEAKLTERSSELRSLKAQRSSLANQVALSTIDVSISATAPPPPPKEATGVWQSLQRGWNALLDFLSAVLNALAVALPFLAFFAALAAAAFIAFRGWRRRHPRTERPAPAGPHPAPATPAEMAASPLL